MVETPQHGSDYQIIHAAPGSTVYAVLRGDIHVRNGSPVYRFVSIEHTVRPLDPATARARPSALLAASQAVVEFHRRGDELEELVAWRDDAAEFSALLLHAPGGQGKSRIAAHLAALSAQEGWTTWAAHHLSDPSGQHVVAPGNPGERLLLVVDYADRWPLDDLLLLLDNPLLRVPSSTRVLLVARSPGPWWPALRHRLAKQGRTSAWTLRLPALATNASERKADFGMAYAAFARALGTSPHPVTPPDSIADNAFAVALTLQMAALVRAHAQLTDGATMDDPVALSAYLLDRENDFWHSTLEGLGPAEPVDPLTMSRTVHLATIAGPVGTETGRTLVERSGIGPVDLSAEHLLRVHSSIYPSLSRDSDVLEPLRPDRLGEDFVALRLPGHDVADYEPDEWSGPATAALLAGESPPAARRGATLHLIEVAKRWPHVRTAALYPALTARPELAVEAGGNALAALADLEDLPVTVRVSVVAAFPPHRHLDLDAGIAHFVRRSFMTMLSPLSAEATAELHLDLAGRLALADMDQDAVEFAQQAVASARRAPVGSTLLAKALHNLGEIQGRLSDSGAGLPALNEAVEVWPRHAGPEAARGLRSSLASRSHLLADLRRPAAALADMERAMMTLDPTPKTIDDLYETGRLLMLYGMRLDGAGKSDAADEPLGHGVNAIRILSRSQPERFQEQLAEALTTWGEHLARQKNYPAALGAFTEAVANARMVAERKGRPDRVLAQALTSRAAAASAAGHVDSSTYADEAVELITSLDGKLSGITQLLYLAHALHVRADALEAKGMHREAFAEREEVVRLRREVHQLSPATGTWPLISALNHLGVSAQRLDLSRVALVASAECLELARKAARVTGVDATPDLVMVMRSHLSIRGSVEVSADDIQAAVEVYEELLRLLRSAAEADPARFSGHLRSSLSDAARFLDAVERINGLAPIARSAGADRLRGLVDTTPSTM